MNTSHVTRRLVAALGAAVLAMGLGMAVATPAYAGVHFTGGGGGAPGDNGFHTGDPN